MQHVRSGLNDVAREGDKNLGVCLCYNSAVDCYPMCWSRNSATGSGYKTLLKTLFIGQRTVLL